MRRRKRLAGSAVCRRRAVLGCCHGPRGLQNASATGTTRAPPAEAGRSPVECSHEQSSWCSWRPFKARARADGGRVLLAPHRAPSVRTGVLNEGQPAQGLSRGRSAPSAVSRSHSSGSQ